MSASASAVSSGSLFSELQSYYQQRKTDVQQLGQALQSGDLAGAQAAFNAIQTLAQNGPSANGNAFSRSGRQSDFAAIGQALQSGDLAGAQQAYAQLQRTFSFNHGAHPVADPTGPAVVVDIGSNANLASSSSSSASAGSAAPSGPEVIVNIGGGSGSSTAEPVTINLSNSSSGGEQLTISVGNQSGGNPEQISINLGSNSNEQIVLNILNSANSSSSSNSSQGSGVNVVA